MNSKLPFLKTNLISGIISKKSLDEIYKNPVTIKDVLEKRRSRGICIKQDNRRELYIL